MGKRKLRMWVALGAAALLAMAGIVPALVGAADHLDAPGLTSPGGDGRLDIADVYAFQSPTDSDNTVLIMTINPVAGVLSPITFHPDASYDIKVDNDGDAKEDLTFKITFSGPGPVQDVRLRAVPAKGGGGAVLASGSTGEDIDVEGGGTLRADVFDDPFFFDLLAFLGAYPFCSAPGGPAGSTGVDFFAGLNVSAIVVEIPSASLGPNDIGVWGRTRLAEAQVDRLGRPAINTVFIPSGSKNAFNEGKPRKDVKDFSQFLGPFGGALLPDILTIDTASSAGFQNGRQLADDVIDIELSLIGVPPGSDCVDAIDVPFLTVFPYLAPAH
ncbi:MAG: DUF4331 family protein [Acidimicrobiia bacterium]